MFDDDAALAAIRPKVKANSLIQKEAGLKLTEFALVVATRKKALKPLLWLIETAQSDRVNVAEIAEKSGLGRTPLMTAIRFGNEEATRALLPVSDAKAVDQEGVSALIMAAERGRDAMVLDLLPESDPLAAGKDGKTALMHCAVRGNFDAVKLLLPMSDAKAVDCNGMSAIVLAAATGSGWAIDCVRILLPKSDPDAIQAAFMTAAGKGHTAIVELLLPLCDPKKPDFDGDTALILAAGHEDDNLLTLLLPLSDAKAANKRGETALMAAAQEGLDQSVRRLLPLSDALAQNNDGDSALMRAASGGREKNVEALLPHSDASQRNKEGRTAFDEAEMTKMTAPRSVMLDLLAETAPRERAEAIFAVLGAEAMPRWAARLEAEDLSATVARAKLEGDGRNEGDETVAAANTAENSRQLPTRARL